MRRVRPLAATAFAAILVLAACSSKPAPPPVVTASPPPLPLPPPRSAPSTPRRVRAEIIRWFWGVGYRDFQIAALVHHARFESGYHPCIAGAAGLRYLYQWGGTRLQNLYAFADAHPGAHPGAHHCPPLDTQLAFANHELRDDPKFSCFWRATTASGALTALRRGFGRGSCD